MKVQKPRPTVPSQGGERKQRVQSHGEAPRSRFPAQTKIHTHIHIYIYAYFKQMCTPAKAQWVNYTYVYDVYSLQPIRGQHVSILGTLRAGEWKRNYSFTCNYGIARCYLYISHTHTHTHIYIYISHNDSKQTQHRRRLFYSMSHSPPRKLA